MNIDVGVCFDVDICVVFFVFEVFIFGRDFVAFVDRGSYFGVYARVVVGGVICVGDDVVLLL